MKSGITLLTIGILALLLVLPACAGDAKGIGISGFLGVQTPVGFTPNRTSEQTNQFVGGLAFSRLPLKTTLTVDLQHSLRSGCLYDPESKLRTTLWFPISRDLQAYTFWERRYAVDQERWVAGVRWNFSVTR